MTQGSRTVYKQLKLFYENTQSSTRPLTCRLHPRVSQSGCFIACCAEPGAVIQSHCSPLALRPPVVVVCPFAFVDGCRAHTLRDLVPRPQAATTTLPINDPLNAIGKAGEVTMTESAEVQCEIHCSIQVSHLKLDGLLEEATCRAYIIHTRKEA